MDFATFADSQESATLRKSANPRNKHQDWTNPVEPGVNPETSIERAFWVLQQIALNRTILREPDRQDELLEITENMVDAAYVLRNLATYHRL